MVARLTNQIGVPTTQPTRNTTNIGVTPAPQQAPATTPPPTGWAPAKPAAVTRPSDGFTINAGRPTNPPAIRQPVQVQANPAAIISRADAPPIAQRFDAAAADGLITSGEVDQLMHSVATRSLSETDVTQLTNAIAANRSKLEPAAANRLDRFMAGEVPRLRDLRIQEQALGNNTVTVSWDPPTTNTDGSALNDLAGFKVHVGSQPGVWDQVITVADPGAGGYAVDKLGSGPKYLMVTAYNAAGEESAPSNQASKVIP